VLYHIYCLDKPDHLDTRLENRAAHLAHLAELGDRLFAAGPLQSEDGTMIGSVLIIDFESLDDAQKFCARDPYVQAQLFEQVSISAWKKVLP